MAYSPLAVPRSLVSQTNPTEAQFDTMRTALISYFNNGAHLGSASIVDGGMVYTSLSAPGDSVDITWENDWAYMHYDQVNDKFCIYNTEGDILIAHLVSSTSLLEFFSLRGDDAAIEVFGIPTFNTSTGSQYMQLMDLIANYRKPKLVYTDDSIVTIEANGADGNTYIAGKDRLWKVFDTTCSLAVDGNGETAADVGTAVSGRGAGVARTADRWYYIYAVEVQYGTQADGINCILIANKLPPISSNLAALNTAFTTDKWVYMGLVRNGWNRASNDDKIVPFVNDESGYMRFTKTLVANEPIGLLLATQKATTSLSHALAFGNTTDTTLPEVATRAIFGGYREGFGFELQYEANATSELHMINSGTEHVTDLSSLEPCVYMEVPLLASYNVWVRIGNVDTEQRITLAGLVDHYV